MKTIWKFSLSHLERNEIKVPRGSKLLSVQVQCGRLFVWVLVGEKEASKCDYRTKVVSVYGTGFDVPDDPGRFVGTIVDGEFVWHVFEKGDND